MAVWDACSSCRPDFRVLIKQNRRTELQNLEIIYVERGARGPVSFRKFGADAVGRSAEEGKI